MNAWHDKRDGQWIEAAPPANTRFVEQMAAAAEADGRGLPARPRLFRRHRAAARTGRPRCGRALLQPGAELARQRRRRAVRQEARGHSAARDRRGRRARLRSTRSGRSRGRPTPASATGTTTARLYEQNGYKSAEAGRSSGSPTSCRRTATCCSTSPCAATARSTTRKRRSSTGSPRGCERNGEAIFGTRAVAQLRRRADEAARGHARTRMRRSHSRPRTCASRRRWRALRDLPGLARAARARSRRLARDALPDAVIERVELLGGPTAAIPPRCRMRCGFALAAGPQGRASCRRVTDQRDAVLRRLAHPHRQRRAAVGDRRVGLCVEMPSARGLPGFIQRMLITRSPAIPA